MLPIIPTLLLVITLEMISCATVRGRLKEETDNFPVYWI